MKKLIIKQSTLIDQNNQTNGLLFHVFLEFLENHLVNEIEFLPNIPHVGSL